MCSLKIFGKSLARIFVTDFEFLNSNLAKLEQFKLFCGSFARDFPDLLRTVLILRNLRSNSFSFCNLLKHLTRHVC